MHINCVLMKKEYPISIQNPEWLETQDGGHNVQYLIGEGIILWG